MLVPSSAPCRDILHIRFDISALIMAEPFSPRLAPDRSASTCRMASNRTYDHRLIQSVQETGDSAIATRLGVPKSTVSGWIRRSPRDVVSASGLDESAAELRVRVARLERRVHRLAAMLRILFALVRIL